MPRKRLGWQSAANCRIPVRAFVAYDDRAVVSGRMLTPFQEKNLDFTRAQGARDHASAEPVGRPTSSIKDLAPILALPWIIRLRYGMTAGEAAIVLGHRAGPNASGLRPVPSAVARCRVLLDTF
jgi:hypothetical protein